MLRLASQCPISIDSSRVFPSTTPATNPPAKASLIPSISQVLRKRTYQYQGQHSPCTISIADILLLDFLNPKLLNPFLPLHRHNRTLRPLREHHRPLTPFILLWQIRHQLRNLLHILRLMPLRLGPAPRLRLIPNDIIPILARLRQLILEKQRDERRGQAHDEHLVLLGRFLRQRHDRGHTDRQVVPADEVDLGLLREFPDLGRLQMRDLVLVGGGQVRAHGTVVAGDDDAAAAGGVVGGDEVFGADAGVFVLGAQGRGVLVGADAADVEGGVGG